MTALRAPGVCPSCAPDSNPNQDPHVIKCCHFNGWLVWVWEFSEEWAEGEGDGPHKSWCVEGPVPDDYDLRNEGWAGQYPESKYLTAYITDLDQAMRLYEAMADPDHIIAQGSAPTALTSHAIAK